MTFKELRKQANLSVEYVSKKLGRKPQTIYKCSFRLPSFHILTQMSEIYKVDLEELLKTYEIHKKIFFEKELQNGRNIRKTN